jgi:F-type H+-transporting ATPase subunit b
MRQAHWTTLALATLWPAEAHAATGGEEPNLFAGTLLQSLAAIIAFLLVLLILRKYAWGPILKGLQDRENQIKQDLQGAEQANAQARRTLAEYEQTLAEAHADSRKLLDQARADAQELRAKLKDETEREMANLRQRAGEEIDLARQHALADLHAHAAELATAVAAKVIGRQITDADTQRLVDESLQELDRLN